MVKSWNIYDANGNYVNGIVGTEETVQQYCQEHGYTYEVDPNWVPPLTEDQTRLIREHNWAEDRIGEFLEHHSWASSRETFALAIRQYNSLVDYYLVLHERVVLEGLENRLHESSGGSGGSGGDLFG